MLILRRLLVGALSRLERLLRQQLKVAVWAQERFGGPHVGLPPAPGTLVRVCDDLRGPRGKWLHLVLERPASAFGEASDVRELCWSPDLYPSGEAPAWGRLWSSYSGDGLMLAHSVGDSLGWTENDGFGLSLASDGVWELRRFGSQLEGQAAWQARQAPPEGARG